MVSYCILGQIFSANPQAEVRREKKDDSDVATSVKYAVTSSSSWSNAMLPTSKGEHLEQVWTSWPAPKGKPIGSHMVG